MSFNITKINYPRTLMMGETYDFSKITVETDAGLTIDKIDATWLDVQPPFSEMGYYPIEITATATTGEVATTTVEVFAFEKALPSIVLKEANPHIEIAYESNSYRNYIREDSKTTFVIKNQPRIFVNYENSVDVYRVRDDVSSIMQFFGLLLGHVSVADDIRLDLEGQRFKSWLYINKDLSYNLYARNSHDELRTNFSDMTDMVEKYFTQWYDFCYNESFTYIRRMYFRANEFKEIFAEDILVEYVRILEGYHLRISQDEDKLLKLKQAIKDSEKEIKKMIFTDEGKPLFEKAFRQEIPNWKFNSDHSTEVAHWIACGYLGKKGLAQRIKELDDTYFNIIAKNSRHILDSSRNKKTDTETTEEQLTEQFYKNIVATRNYFSHYKLDITNVLEFSQMNYTINALKALIICILYSHMGMNTDTIREIISRDAELMFQTGFLAKKKEIDG